MKKIFILVMLLPVFCFGQRFEVSEIVGYSQNFAKSNLFTPYNPDKGYFKSGFVNQLSVNYFFSKSVSIGLSYEFMAWKPTFHSVGVNSTVYFKNFFLGATVSMVNASRLEQPKLSYYSDFKSAASATAIAGFRQKLHKKIYIKEQIGVTFATDLKGVTYYSGLFSRHFLQPVSYWFAGAGICFKL